MSEPPPIPESSALRIPASKRIALPASQRLSSITEGLTQAPDPGRWSRLRASTSSAATGRTPPPPYEWVHESDTDNDGRPVSEEEKFARLRRPWTGVKGTRGGCGRLVLLVTVLLLVIGLAVGLGVGFTTGRKKHKDGESTLNGSAGIQPSDSSSLIQQFPLGQYSFTTTLRAQDTNCTSNPATWRCYPYTVFSPSDQSTSTSSQSTFDWIIRNDSAIFATNTSTSPTPADGIPANLTLSSTNNPFALTFAPQPLIYHADSNSTSSRLTFSFSLRKVVVPTSAITSNNAATQCFFNNTSLSGTIYLAAPRDATASVGSYEQWPYAVEVLQSSPGGQNTPDCYEMVNGGIGKKVDLGAVANGNECQCEYRNY